METVSLPRTLVVQVTDEHVRNGVRHSTYSCPIALALREELDSEHFEYKDVGVGGSIVEIYDANGVWLYDTPREARNLIYHFDRGEAVTLPTEPIEFRGGYFNPVIPEEE